MKISQLLLFLALLGYCFTDECGDQFQQLIQTQCLNINDSCSFYDFAQKCVSTFDCSNGNDENRNSNACDNILPSNFPQKKCQMNSQFCEPVDTVCSDFNTGFGGVSFDPLKDRSYCDQFKATTIGKKCLVSNSGSCDEFFGSCNGLNSVQCNGNLISYTRECQWIDSTCTPVKRNCDNALLNVNEEECHALESTDRDKKCIYKNGVCFAEFISCQDQSHSDCERKNPLIENGNDYDLTKNCTYVTSNSGTGSCVEKKQLCSLYEGKDSTVCPNLEVTDKTKKRCVYDPTGTSRICKEEYLTCELYNDFQTSKARKGCESISLADSSKKCIYINEIDKCMQTDIFSTCEEYKGIDKYICESIITPTNHSKCYLEKDRTCKERMFNCTEVHNEEDCLYYAKPVDSRKKCVYSSGKCYEEYQRCEDYSPLDETVSSCSSIKMHNGKKCYTDSTGLCRTKNKTCEDANNDEDECNLIAQSGVSNPDKKVCQYDTSNNECQENYKYCSDYRGNNVNNKCTNIKPYDDSGNNIDRAFECQYTNEVGCEKISKTCGAADGDPDLCSLISPNIKDNNVKYCFYDSNSDECIEQYKYCENITSTGTTCTENIPQNYLTEHCKVSTDNKCISKKTCEEFNGNNYYQYLCENIPNCTYSSNGACEKNTTTEACNDVEFFILSDQNEEICQKIETNNPNTKCVLKEDKRMCEEIVIKPTPSNTTQENSSGFLSKGIQYLIVLLCLFV